MTSKNTADPDGDDSLGVLDDTASSDTSAIGLLGGTAQVRVSLPTGGEDDDLVDDEVVDGEIVSDLIIDTSAVADADTLARIQQDASEIVIELPAEDVQPEAAEDPAVVVEVVDEDATPDDDASAPLAVAAPTTPDTRPAEKPGTASGEKSASGTGRKPRAKSASDVQPDPAGDAGPPNAEPAAGEPAKSKPAKTKSVKTKPAGKTKPAAEAKGATEAKAATEAKPAAEAAPAADPAADRARADAATASSAAAETAEKDEPAADQPAVDASGLSHLESVVAAAKAELQEAMSPAPVRTTGAAPDKPGRPEEVRPVTTNDPVPASRPASETGAHSAADKPEVVLTSKRLDDLGDGGRESADLLTADRLLDPSRVSRPEPEGAWSHLLYTITGGRINIGDGRKARERKQLSARIAAPMPGNARFVPVLSRKGGVGKTTITALLGMALADARDDRVIAVDANPDRGTLAERVVGSHTKSVRDLVRAQHDIRGFYDISALVARDETRLDVLASDSDPRVSEAFGDGDYRDVATVAAQYYSLVLTDSGTGIVHSVMGATLDLADQLVIVSGLSVDEARLASETLTWLETNGHAALAREAIVVLNQSTPGAPLVRLSELESHFSTRAKHVLRVPYDPQIAGGGAIDFGNLQPETRRAAREIAATLVEGLRAKAA
ncbi:nucleotide-binding protein [Microbacterium sp. MAHUQ-60]|uniref:nucleotide-binding protein n=1 Tax=unclassified Microbacterium TaxID=2609290 RepID=UPI0036096A43